MFSCLSLLPALRSPCSTILPSFPNVVACYLPTFTRRMIGHSLGNPRAANFSNSPFLIIMRVQCLSLQPPFSLSLSLRIVIRRITCKFTANKMQLFLNISICTDALHVSGGSSAHHQEHKTVHTASGIVKQYCC